MKDITHHSETGSGTPSRSNYSRGCRCPECTEAQRVYTRRYRRGLRDAVPPNPEVEKIDGLIQQAMDAGDTFTVRALNEAKDDLLSRL